ncbi:hypothetical protein IB252_25520 [Pseudomonas sp. PDM10]|uniref:hypothetical protein n=1 Tax=Pseudomonas sp. PDM10 TaxID=2769269 RepID=UPI001780231B|nr:hypothetical protein [Pseudomonas sp. PDM10]MBD9603182.1 hypothetical protein [Pseudomonas sp. PDM10]
MNKINILLLLASLTLTSYVMASPVYLDCVIKHSEGVIKFTVKADEDTGKITQTNEAGGAFNAEGFYSTNDITYQQSDIGGGVKFTYTYTINRSNLSLSRLFRVEPANPEYASQIPAKTSMEQGSCDIAKPVKRKI